MPDQGGRALGDVVAARGRTQAVAVLAQGLVVLLAACGSDPRRPIAPEFDLRHPSASRRLEAIATTAAQRDTAHVPALFDLLDDDDDAVRLSAASALRDLVGRDPGYTAYAPREERIGAAKRWRAIWQGDTRPAPTSTPSAPRGYTGSPGVPAR